MNDQIAEIDLMCIKPDGENVPVAVKIGRPYLGEDDLWACPVSLADLYPRLSDVKSDDSFQSLCLTIHLVRNLLTYFKEDGGLIYFSGNKQEEFSLEAYFPPFSNDNTINDRITSGCIGPQKPSG